MNAAVKSIPGVARTHFARWGDGSEHFHLWALARPAGMMQGRGPMLAFWDDVLPEMPAELAQEHLRIVAESLAAGGGAAFPYRYDGQLEDRLEAVLVVPLLPDLDERSCATSPSEAALSGETVTRKTLTDGSDLARSIRCSSAARA